MSLSPPRTQRNRNGRRARAGFTLLETVLASVIGSFVLLGCFALFLSMSRVENSMNRASRQMEELAMTQQILRKSFMTVALIGEQAAREQGVRARRGRGDPRGPVAESAQAPAHHRVR